MIRIYWAVMEKYLKKYSPAVYKTLAPPAADSQIDKLIQTAELRIPDSFIQSLLIHDGQNDEDGLFPLFDYQHILSCNQIISKYNMMNELFPDEDVADYIDPSQCQAVRRYYIWNKKWLPITDSNGSGHILDFHPVLTGMEGQIFYRPNSDNPPDQVLAVSYADWMMKICAKLENGEFKMEDEAIVLDRFTFNW